MLSPPAVRPSFFLVADDSLASLGEKDDDDEEEAGCTSLFYKLWAWVKMHTTGQLQIIIYI